MVKFSIYLIRRVFVMTFNYYCVVVIGIAGLLDTSNNHGIYENINRFLKDTEHMKP